MCAQLVTVPHKPQVDEQARELMEPNTEADALRDGDGYPPIRQVPLGVRAVLAEGDQQQGDFSMHNPACACELDLC